MKPSRLMIDSALELLFPSRCPFCGKIAGGRIPCVQCFGAVEECRRDKPLVEWRLHSFYAISKAYSAFQYEGPVRTAILKAKSGSPWYIRELTDELAVNVFGYLPRRRLFAMDYEEIVPLNMVYDCIIPVPDSGNGRGYWVTALLARRLGQITGLPVDTVSLRKIRKTKRQAGLSREERLYNLVGAFGVPNARRIEGKRVLLVDDIITTGSTVSCCAVTLLQAGAAEVTAVSLAAAENAGNP